MDTARAVGQPACCIKFVTPRKPAHCVVQFLEPAPGPTHIPRYSAVSTIQKSKPIRNFISQIITDSITQFRGEGSGEGDELTLIMLEMKTCGKLSFKKYDVYS